MSGELEELRTLVVEAIEQGEDMAVCDDALGEWAEAGCPGYEADAERIATIEADLARYRAEAGEVSSQLSGLRAWAESNGRMGVAPEASAAVIALAKAYDAKCGEVTALRAQFAEANEGIAAGRCAAQAAREMTDALLDVAEVLGDRQEAPIVLAWRLVAQLAEARNLRLWRAPTGEEIADHGHDGRWLARLAASNRWLHLRGDSPAWIQCDDAIPIDANSQPCPVGGWGGES